MATQRKSLIQFAFTLCQYDSGKTHCLHRLRARLREEIRFWQQLMKAVEVQCICIFYKTPHAVTLCFEADFSGNIRPHLLIF